MEPNGNLTDSIGIKCNRLNYKESNAPNRFKYKQMKEINREKIKINGMELNGMEWN